MWPGMCIATSAKFNVLCVREVMLMQQDIERARRWRAGLKFVSAMVLAIALIAILVRPASRL